MKRVQNSPPSAKTRRTILFAGAGIIAAAAASVTPAWATRSANKKVRVYKTPTCGCCSAWVKHLTAAGFDTQIVDRPDLTPIRARFGAPEDLRSCHLAIIGRYIVEGHVPAASINKLLSEAPDASGIFVPGMPPGSPGMEGPHDSQPYDVILLRKNGKREVFDRYDA
ncbi:MAG TPA: hypothetical protein DDZ68_04925 [Parvularcula sp.]|jgi:hypothetical protein|nr:hypothetical protein [Parvularcula sp.]